MAYMFSVCCNTKFLRSSLLLFCIETLFCKWTPVTFITKVSAFFGSYQESKVFFVAFAYAVVPVSWWNLKLHCMLFYASFETLLLWCIPFIPIYILTVGSSLGSMGSRVWVDFFYEGRRN